MIPCTIHTTSADLLRSFQSALSSFTSSSASSSTSSSAIYLEIGGDRLRRLDEDEAPLKLVLQLLVDMGLENEEEAKCLATDASLESIVKLYAGK